MGNIDVMMTEIGTPLRAAKMLSDAVAWYESLTPQITRQIILWIQDDQLTKEGIDSTGEVIGYYSQLTEILSGGKKKFGDHYTLNDTGAFYRGMFVVVLNDGLVIDSDGANKIGKKKDENLFEKYGENIVGLTDENMAKLIEALKPKYIESVKRMLYLNR